MAWLACSSLCSTFSLLLEKKRTTCIVKTCVVRPAFTCFFQILVVAVFVVPLICITLIGINFFYLCCVYHFILKIPASNTKNKAKSNPNVVMLNVSIVKGSIEEFKYILCSSRSGVFQDQFLTDKCTSAIVPFLHQQAVAIYQCYNKTDIWLTKLPALVAT